MKKRGNRLGFLFFEMVVRTSGLKAAYSFLYPVCLHYYLFDREARTAAMAYVRRRYPEASTCRKHMLVYRLFVSQGRCLIDRYVYRANPSVFDVKLHGFSTVDELLSDPSKGFVLETAHVGNWQLAMNSLSRWNRRVHLLMLPEHNEAVRKSLGIQNSDDTIQIISVADGMDGMIRAMKALENGDVVSIMGDRHYGARSVPVDFLDSQAWFPCSAYWLAASAGCPVVTLLSAKLENRSYAVEIADVFTPVWNRDVPRNEMLKQWTQRFACCLADYLQKHPLQCFLFHDVWRECS